MDGSRANTSGAVLWTLASRLTSLSDWGPLSVTTVTSTPAPTKAAIWKNCRRCPPWPRRSGVSLLSQRMRRAEEVTTRP